MAESANTIAERIYVAVSRKKTGCREEDINLPECLIEELQREARLAEVESIIPLLKRAASMLAMLADRGSQGRKTIDDFADELYEKSMALRTPAAGTSSVGAPEAIDGICKLCKACGRCTKDHIHCRKCACIPAASTSSEKGERNG